MLKHTFPENDLGFFASTFDAGKKKMMNQIRTLMAISYFSYDNARCADKQQKVNQIFKERK
jgi:hypothetical protein